MRITTTQLGEVNVKFHHERWDDLNYVSAVSKKKKSVTDTFTECTIEVEKEGFSALGRSYLHPADKFDKEQGRLKSLERALESLDLASNKTKREIMAGYYSR